MSRLEKKCLIASAGAHSVLVLFLAVAPLFLVANKPSLTVLPLNFIPTRLVDGAMSGGGSPQAKAMPPLGVPEARPQVVTPPAIPKPQVKPPAADPKPAREEAEPAPKPKRKSAAPAITERKLPLARPEDNDDGGDTKPGKRTVEPEFTRATSSSRENSRANELAQALANARATQQARAARIGSILGTLTQGVSSGTSIEMPGPGGEAFADYKQFVMLVYRNAWNPPSTLSDASAKVEATVVILRSGKVASFHVTKHSGNAALDKSVARLVSVQSIAPFPEGAPDKERIFIVEFDPQLKKSF